MSDQAIVMLMGLLLLIFSDDWHWGAIGAVLLIGGAVLAFINERWL